MLSTSGTSTMKSHFRTRDKLHKIVHLISMAPICKEVVQICMPDKLLTFVLVLRTVWLLPKCLYLGGSISECDGLTKDTSSIGNCAGNRVYSAHIKHENLHVGVPCYCPLKCLSTMEGIC